MPFLIRPYRRFPVLALSRTTLARSKAKAQCEAGHLPNGSSELERQPMTTRIALFLLIALSGL